MGDSELLVLREIESGYQKKKVIRGLTLAVKENEITALIGHNGAGKTTLLRTIFRLVPATNGHIYYAGEEITSVSTAKNKRLSISFVPQEKSVFPNLTVEENLRLAFKFGGLREELEKIPNEVLEIFPPLKNRVRSRALTLSGGLKQMLAVSMAFVQRPKLLLLDEPSLGLAPIVVQDLMQGIKEYKRSYQATVLLVEQNLKETFQIADTVCIMKMGEIVFHGKTVDIENISSIIDFF